MNTKGRLKLQKVIERKWGTVEGFDKMGMVEGISGLLLPALAHSLFLSVVSSCQAQQACEARCSNCYTLERALSNVQHSLHFLLQIHSLPFTLLWILGGWLMDWLLVGFSEWEAMADRGQEEIKLVCLSPCLLPAEPQADSSCSIPGPKAQLQYCCPLLQLLRFAPSLTLSPRRTRWLCC